MTCGYCGSRNADGEHRCGRCGRRPGDLLNGSPHLRTAGALATQPKQVAQPVAEPAAAPNLAPRSVPNLSRAVQGSLFLDNPASKVVPIRAAAPPPRGRQEPGAKTAVRQPARRAPRVPEGQGSLEFLSAAQPKPRTLGTTVEAVIYCEAPVATPLHRAVGAALDWSMVLIGFGLFLLVFRLAGGEFAIDKLSLMTFGGALLSIALAYGLVWAIPGSETAGMRWAHLRLTTFDGFPPEKKQRLVRLAGTCLSLCTVIGLLWSLADEESLGWQDHISRTFPTPRESESQVLHRR
jgi:hypothetical protein